MDKKQLTTILQVCIFSFDGATEKEIFELNDYDSRLVKIGVKLAEHLKNLEVKNASN